MEYTLKATPQFWKSFNGLTADQQALAKAKLKLFALDPFDPRLGTHRIALLSARYRRTVYSVVIGGDLRAVFFQLGNEIHSFDIGSHDIYR